MPSKPTVDLPEVSGRSSTGLGNPVQASFLGATRPLHAPSPHLIVDAWGTGQLPFLGRTRDAKPQIKGGARDGEFGEDSFVNTDKDVEKLRLTLLGTFGLSAPDGTPFVISGRKSCAVVAMLATEPNGTRGRRWLQNKLWSDRGDKEGAGSLRQSLSEIRRCLGPFADVIEASRHAVTLDLDRIHIDIREISDAEGWQSDDHNREFLEDLEIRDKEYEVWLREQRRYWADQIGQAQMTQTGQSSAPVTPPSGPDLVAQPITGTPTVAVKPFTLSTDQEVHPYLLEGLAQGMIDQISRIRWLSVIARSSSFAPGHEKLTPEEFGHKKGAEYVVHGLIQSTLNGLVLNTELVRSSGGRLVWSKSIPIELPVSDQSLVQIAAEVAGNLGASVSQIRAQLSFKQGTRNAEADDLVWLGRWHLNRLTKEDAAKAQDLFEKALVLDDGNVEAHIHLAWCSLWQSWATRGDQGNIEMARDLGQKAITLDVADGRGYWIVGTAEAWLRNGHAAEHYMNEATRLCPSLSIAYAQQGSNRILAGNPMAAFEPLQRALALSPFDQQKFYFLGEMSMAAALLRRTDEAIKYAEQSLLLRPAYWYAQVVRVMAYTDAHMPKDADRAAQVLFENRPNLSREDIEWLPFLDRRTNAKMISDIAKAAKSIGQTAFK